MQYYTADSAKQAYDEYSSLTGKKEKNQRRKLKEKGVFGLAGTDEIDKETNLHKFKKVPINQKNAMYTLFPREGGGFIGVKNKDYEKWEIKNGLDLLKDILTFDEKLRLSHNTEQTSDAEPASNATSSTTPDKKPSTTPTDVTPQEPHISDPPKPVKEPPPHIIQNMFQEARDKRKALEKFADETSSLSEGQKGKIFSRRFLKATKDMDGKQTSKEALQRFSDRYGLDVDLSGYKTSMRGRIWSRLNGRENLTEQEAMEKLYNAYFDKTNEYIGEQKKRLLNGEISKDQFTRRVNAGYSDYAARKAGGITNVAKNGHHFKFGGKIGAVAGLVGLGAVIGSMFSGGHKSNAELYNPNPQPQYYS